MAKMRIVDWLAIILLIVGGLNWGLVGVFNFNLVSGLLTMIGMASLLGIVYALVGIASVWSVYSLWKNKGR